MIKPVGASGEPELLLLRERLRLSLTTEIAAMARYFGDHYIDARDLVEDVLVRVLDDAMTTEPILRAEQAALDEIVALKHQLAAAVVPSPPAETLKREKRLRIGDIIEAGAHLEAEIRAHVPTFPHSHIIRSVLEKHLSLAALPSPPAQED